MWKKKHIRVSCHRNYRVKENHTKSKVLRLLKRNFLPRCAFKSNKFSYVFGLSGTIQLVRSTANCNIICPKTNPSNGLSFNPCKPKLYRRKCSCSARPMTINYSPTLWILSISWAHQSTSYEWKAIRLRIMNSHRNVHRFQSDLIKLSIVWQ